MNAHQSVRRGIAVVSSGALVVGAGASVGILAAQMADQWSTQAALEAAASVVVDPTADLNVPRPVVVTRTKVRHITPDPVVVHKKVYVQTPTAQAPATRYQAPAPRVASAPRTTTTTRKPSRTVVAPAPKPAAPKPQPASGGTTSKTS
jgi:hypothetical protein